MFTAFYISVVRSCQVNTVVSSTVLFFFFFCHTNFLVVSYHCAYCQDQDLLLSVYPAPGPQTKLGHSGAVYQPVYQQ